MLPPYLWSWIMRLTIALIRILLTVLLGRCLSCTCEPGDDTPLVVAVGRRCNSTSTGPCSCRQRSLSKHHTKRITNVDR